MAEVMANLLPTDQSPGIPSYIGMVIESTTLDTMAKVINIYGGTTWIQHSGYVLRGASSGVTANNATKTGGNDDAVVVRHRHASAADGYRFISVSTSGAGSRNTNWATSGSYDFSYGAYTAYEGENGTNKNIPNYKSVYIWERTV